MVSLISRFQASRNSADGLQFEIDGDEAGGQTYSTGGSTLRSTASRQSESAGPLAGSLISDQSRLTAASFNSIPRPGLSVSFIVPYLGSTCSP